MMSESPKREQFQKDCSNEPLSNDLNLSHTLIMSSEILDFLSKLLLSPVNHFLISRKTILQYSLSRQGLVAISIYDLEGSEVTNLIDGIQNAGQHYLTWDAHTFPSGIYFARLTAGSQSQDRKMILLK